MNSYSSQFEEVERLLSKFSNEVNFTGPKDESSIAKAEGYLGVRFPPSYREFLRRWGMLGFGHEEFYGITSDNFETARVPNGIWFTARKREQSCLPKSLIVIINVDGDQYLCIDTSQVDEEGESPVVIWDLSSREILGRKAKNFALFLLERLEEAIEIIEEEK